MTTALQDLAFSEYLLSLQREVIAVSQSVCVFLCVLRYVIHGGGGGGDGRV